PASAQSAGSAPASSGCVAATAGRLEARTLIFFCGRSISTSTGASLVPVFGSVAMRADGVDETRPPRIDLRF
ncbi:unnamed protein product, partial [Musa textilis]